MDPPATPAASQSISVSTSASTSKKRTAGSSSKPNPRAAKKAKTKSASPRTLKDGSSAQVEENDEEREPQCQLGPALQVCRYLLEMFSVPLLRSHATVGLVDRDRLQLYHANRSVILVSSAIKFSKDDGKDKLIATVIAFHCLSLEQNGILEARVPGNPKLVSSSHFPQKSQVVQQGNKLWFSKNKKGNPFTVTLGEVISRDPAMVGRSTVVLKATSDEWKGVPLVVKISWPTSGRVPETAFLKEASDKAKDEHAWAANHLPKVYHTEDVVFEPDSTLGSVAALFKDGKIVHGDHVYEPRTLRIIVQEELHTLRSLGNVKDIGQVLLDVAGGTCGFLFLDFDRLIAADTVHHWLYEHAGILHRDLSIRNTMWRFIKEKNARGEGEQRVYGVLTDFDLSSWVDSLNSDYKKTSQQRTGTPPYMAHELLGGSSPIHLYRHDLESFFYIMLLIGTRHEIGIPQDESEPRVVMRRSKGLPFQTWFNEQCYDTLGSLKWSFLSKMQPIRLSSVFEDFRPWLEDLQLCFSQGFTLRSSSINRGSVPWRAAAEPAAARFDDETLGGWVTYAKIIAPVPHFTGELEGLVIRDPKGSRLVSTSAGSDRHRRPAPTILSSIISSISSASTYFRPSA